MAEIISKIVLTEGPCAGKTTALARIEQDLQEKGYQVLIVSESATELIKGGIRPFGKNSVSMFDFQKIIIPYQLKKESTYEEAIKFLPDHQKVVIIFDRGVMDNKAYISQEEFEVILKEQKLNKIELLDRYDMVIHLVTSALGKEEFYTLDNNQARTESVEEAKIMDRKTLASWLGHNNLIIIDNKDNFEEKINNVLTTIHNLLGNPLSLKKQRMFTVDLNNSSLIENCVQIELEYYYLESDDYEKRIKKRIQNNQITYYLTIQKREKDGLSKIVLDKKINPKEALKLLNSQKIKSSLKKTRFCFERNRQYYKLDIYPNSDVGLLQLDMTVENPSLNLPKELKILEEVTGDFNYQSYNISLRGNNAKIKKRNY